MSTDGVHYLALAKSKQRLAENAIEYEHASAALSEAVKLGDLSENSEYDAAKATLNKVIRERDALSPVLGMTPLKAKDNVDIIEEGCVVKFALYDVTPSPMDPNSEEFNKLVTAGNAQFSGTLMFGGTLPVQELLEDSALSATTPVGRYLLGKQSGRYSIQVPGGFANVEVSKLRSTEYTPEEIKCEYRG